MTSVFISYSHDNDDHRRRVLALADRLIAEEGLDVELDQYHEASPPAVGWELWAEKLICKSMFTIIVCTAEYRAAFDDDLMPEARRGVRSEAQIVRQILYQAGQRNKNFICVLFDDCADDCIPLRLKSLSPYRIFDEYERLIRQITQQPHAPRANASK